MRALALRNILQADLLVGPKPSEVVIPEGEQGEVLEAYRWTLDGQNQTTYLVRFENVTKLSWWVPDDSILLLR